MNRVLLSGYYGFGNAGDEAVLAAILGSLRQQSPEMECTVLSAAPAATREAHGVPAFHRARPREVLTAMRRCSLFISGGGSLLQDVTSLNSLLFYLVQIRLAAALRRRVMVYAQGIGPLLRPSARRLTTRVLRGVDWITVRDKESAAELRRIGLTTGSPPVEVTADPVFALEPAAREWARDELSRCLATTSSQMAAPEFPGSGGATPGLPLLGVSVREWPGLEARLDALGEVIRVAAAEMRGVPVYFPLQRVQDASACRRLLERTGGCVLLGDYSAAQWLALAREMHLFLGMRLHALIFAAVGGVPTVGLSYDPKVTSLLNRLGQAPATTMQAFDSASVAAALRNTWNERERQSVQIAAAARELSAAAQVSARRAVELASCAQCEQDVVRARASGR